MGEGASLVVLTKELVPCGGGFEQGKVLVIVKVAALTESSGRNSGLGDQDNLKTSLKRKALAASKTLVAKPGS